MVQRESGKGKRRPKGARRKAVVAEPEAQPELTEAERHMVFLKFYRAKLMEASRKSPEMEETYNLAYRRTIGNIESGKTNLKFIAGQMLRDLVRLGILKLDYKKALEHPEVFNKLLDDLVSLELPNDDLGAMIAELQKRKGKRKVDTKLSDSPIFPELVINGERFGPDSKRGQALDQTWIREVQAAVKTLKESGHDPGQGARWGVVAGCHERCEDAIRVLEKVRRALPMAMKHGPEGLSLVNEAFSGGMLASQRKAWDVAEETRAGMKAQAHYDRAADRERQKAIERETLILERAVQAKIRFKKLGKGLMKFIAEDVSGQLSRKGFGLDTVYKTILAWNRVCKRADRIKGEHPSWDRDFIAQRITEQSREPLDTVQRMLQFWKPA